MLAFVLRRLLHALAIVALATLGSFALLRMAPGDPLQLAVDAPGLQAHARDVRAARAGLDRPLSAQVIAYAGRLARADFGTSLTEQRPVSAVLADALPATLLLSGAGLLLATLVGVFAGTLQGWRPHDRLARWTGTALTALYAMPEVVVALLFLAVLGVQLRLFPVGGMSDPLTALTGDAGARLRDRVMHLALPAITLALTWGAAIARQQRVAITEASRDYHVRTARAKGVGARGVLTRHAMRPSLAATLAILGTMLPVLVGGTVVIESLFAWPGMGSLIVRSVSLRDYPVVGGAVVIVSVVVALGSLLTDITVRALDPRMRSSAS